MSTQKELWRAEAVVRHTQFLLDSYRSLVGDELCARIGSCEDQARAVYELPIVVVSHGLQTDPVFNYANRVAQETFEMSWDEITRLPSRFSAEPVEREERERLMQEVRANGCIRNYRGIRISKNGRRFRVEDATVWTLFDDQQKPWGQAAALFRWTFL